MAQLLWEDEYMRICRTFERAALGGRWRIDRPLGHCPGSPPTIVSRETLKESCSSSYELF